MKLDGFMRGIKILRCGAKRLVSAFADKEQNGQAAEQEGRHFLRPRRWMVGVCAYSVGIIPRPFNPTPSVFTTDACAWPLLWVWVERLAEDDVEGIVG